MLSPAVLQGRLSHSHASDWEKIFNDLDNDTNADFGTLDTFTVAAPLQSIESLHESGSGLGSTPLPNTLSPRSLVAMNRIQHPQPWLDSGIYEQRCLTTLLSQEQWAQPYSYDYTMSPHELMGAEHTTFHTMPQVHRQGMGENHFLQEASPQLYSDDSTDVTSDKGDVRLTPIDADGSNDQNDPNVDATDPCYAQLLFRCLEAAPDHIMSLKNIYKWMMMNSSKAKGKDKGWQNSVRHNLSMNAAFQRVPANQFEGGKKGSLWRLASFALRNGIKSTTHYRNPPKRKPARRTSPDLARQLSGARGGQATRASARQRAVQQARSTPNPSAIARHQQQQQQKQNGQGLFSIPQSTMHSMPSSPHPVVLTSDAALSPYFVDYEDRSSLNLPAPGMLAGIENPYGPPLAKSTLTDYELAYIDYFRGGLIGNHDDFVAETPTESSFGSYDDHQSVQ